MVTCSMARDRALFDLLAHSVDELVDPAIHHLVVVPRSDLAAFSQYANTRRSFIAQEEALPFKAVKLPTVPRAASRLVTALRRPLYIGPGMRLLRGWILQQALKIEMSRRAQAGAVLHIDSDVFFVRPMALNDVLRNGRLPFFRSRSGAPNPSHMVWIHAAQRMLGLSQTARYASHFIENIVAWDSDAVRAMTQRIEDVGGRPWHDILLSEDAFSEYYVYGVFLDKIYGTDGYWSEQADFCRSYWLDENSLTVDEDWLLDGMKPHHVAMSVQSTNMMTIERRKALCEKARALAAS